jgi:tellurite resistance protein TerC
MMGIGTPAMWGVFAAFVLVAMFVDFAAMRSQGAHRVGMREAAIWSIIWVLVSFVFVAWLWFRLRSSQGVEFANTRALEFITGYLVEKALAVDNIFVFLMVFTYFAVPAEFQKRVLMIGITGAIALRAVLILAGAWLLQQFHWLLYVFGAFLVLTGLKMWWAAGQEPDLGSNPVLKWINVRFRISPTFDGENFFTVRGGVRMATPLLVVVLMIAVVDVIFAVDSIPAIFAITLDPFIVLTSNVFAILGLRALYFLLASVHEKFHLLSYGLALILGLIGTKMLLAEVYKVPAVWSLSATVLILVATMVLSLLVPPKAEPTRPGKSSLASAPAARLRTAPRQPEDQEGR